MKHVFSFLILLSLSFVVHGVNVRDFGAIGDGKHDDTAAFQKAFEAAFVKYTLDSSPKSGQEVLVPAGTYRLTRTLVFRNALVLRGEGKAVLVYDAPKGTVIYGAGRAGRFSGITFRGGDHQLQFWTDNMDASCFDIINCRFENSGKAAIESNSFADRGVKVKGKKKPATIKYPPWNIRKNGDFYDLTPHDLSKYTRFYNSTKLNVEDCSFDNCLQAVDCAADGVTVRRCKIITSRNTDAVFKFGTRVLLYDLDILVKKNDKLSQTVMELPGGTIQMTDSQVRTDNGKDVFLLRHTRKAPGNYLGDSFIFQRIKTMSCKGIIDSVNGTIPQILFVQNLTGLGKNKTKIFHFSTPFSEKSQAVSTPGSYSYQKRFTAKQSFAFSFKDNTNFDTELPVALKQYVRPFQTDLPGRIQFPDRPVFKGKVLNAKDFGIGIKPAATDGVRLKKLFAAARKAPGCTVILPGRDFLVRESIVLPPDIHVFGAGNTHFIAKKHDTVIFSVKNPKKVMLSNLLFSKGKHALEVTGDAANKGLVIMRKCNGYDLTEAAVSAYLGGKKILKDPRTRFFFDGGLWITRLIYEGNTDAVIDNQWIENKLHNHRIKKRIPDSSVVFINYGRLDLIDMLGVPLALRKGARSGIAPKGTLPGDHRWADNYGCMICRHNRFGGEFGGMATIYHFGKAQTRIYGGSSWYGNDYSHSLLGIADSPFADFIASGIIVSPYNKRKNIPDLVCQQNEKKQLTPVKGRILSHIVPHTAEK